MVLVRISDPTCFRPASLTTNTTSYTTTTTIETAKRNRIKCIGRESNPGLAELIFTDGNG
jgi:hypothetical protein